jgi:hypothetical protein
VVVDESGSRAFVHDHVHVDVHVHDHVGRGIAR